jgi:hypothetical protein
MAINPLQFKIAVPDLPVAASAAPSMSGIVTMSSTTHRTAFLMVSEQAFTVAKVYFVLTTSNTGNVYEVSLEGLDVNGDPSGTLFAAGAKASGLTGFANGAIVEATLDTPVNLLAGSFFAVVVKPTTFVGNSAVQGYADAQSGSFFPTCSSSSTSGSSWNSRTQGTCVGLENGSGEFLCLLGNSPIHEIETIVLSDVSSPQMVGNAITLPVDARAIGVWFWTDNDADIKISLLDEDGSTVLRSITFDKDIPYGTSTAFVFALYFDALTLSKNQTYYLLLEGLSSSVTCYSLIAFSVAALHSFNGGMVMNKVVSTAYPVTGTADLSMETDRIVACGLLLDGIGETLTPSVNVNSSLSFG